MLILQQMRDISHIWSHLPSLLCFSVEKARHDCIFIECAVQPKHIQTDQQRALRPFFAIKIKQVAQRATIAHLSPMCQGQISFQKIRTHPSFNACSCYMKVSKGSNQKQQRKSGNTIFPIISLWGYFLDAQGQLTP